MPLPTDAKTFFLGGLFLLAILMAANAAREIVLPLVFAIMLNLLMQPTLRWLERMRVPKLAGALLLDDGLAKASEMMHDGMDHLTITTPDGQVIDEAENSSRVRNDRRTWRRRVWPGRGLDRQAA